jgi:hypothetical protein
MMAGSNFFWTLLALCVMYVTPAKNATLPVKPGAAFARRESQPGMMKVLQSETPLEQELPMAVETGPKPSIKSFYNWYRLQWKENASTTKALTLTCYFLLFDFLSPKIKAIWGERVHSVFDWVYVIPILCVLATETARLRSEKAEVTVDSGTPDE